LLIFCLLGVACVSGINYQEGIAAFRAGEYRRAFIYLKTEAIKGQPDAQYAIGYMYYYGKGVVEDRKKARCWIRIAALAMQPEAISADKALSPPGLPEPVTLRCVM